MARKTTTKTRAKPAPKAPKNKGGRPTAFNENIAAQICGDLANGMSLNAICSPEDMPGLSTVYLWLSQKPQFLEMYTRAREDQADTLADEIIRIADTSKENKGAVAKAKLRCEARKWVAAKLKPKKYGDRISQEITGKDGTPLVPVMNVTVGAE